MDATVTAKSSFTFVDLFAGVGGFHAALKAYGGECVYAVEIDRQAARVYEANWGHPALGDITQDADDDLGVMKVPPHDVLCAGFPCQPFSKSGAQRGMDETRGTLFFNIASIIKARRPAVVILENVRNLIGPRHEHEYDVIIETLRDLGYHVSDAPAVFSPHLLPPELGGAPQVRERVFITATYAPSAVSGDLEFGGPSPVASMADRFGDFEPKRDWEIESILDDSHNVPGCELTDAECLWFEAWEEFVQLMRPEMGGRHLPGFPIWADSWLDFPEVARLDWKARSIRAPTSVSTPPIDDALPDWKKSHLRKNYDLFSRHFAHLVPWAFRWGVFTEKFPASRRKLEWQAQETKQLKDCLIHLRPSGIRAKKANYLPALVAITQTSIVGPRERRLSPRETARLQGLPDGFVFPGQSAAATYKQMGNGVNVGAVWHVIREHVRRDAVFLANLEHEDVERIEGARVLLRAVNAAPKRPNEILSKHRPALAD
jgi:DNA (cytosine-5)-methyltransferase 1